MAAQTSVTPAPAVPKSAASAISTPVVPAGTNLNDPQVLLSLASSANSLDDPKVTPWHLKASYEISSASSPLLDIGTFEEWYLAPNRWKRIYSSDEYKQTEYETPEGRSYEADAGAPPWPISLVGKELTHPMPDTADTDGTEPDFHSLGAKASNLGCVMLSPPLKKAEWPLGLFPTYCFNPGSAMLRLELFDGGVQAIRNQMATFRDIYLAKEINVTDDGTQLLRIHLISLSGLTESEVSKIAIPSPAKQENLTQVGVSSGVIAGNKLGGPQPRYPAEAKQNHIQGKVVMQAIIGTDGRVHQLRIISSPDELLSVASVAAVERWFYKPYMLMGKPVSVKTTVNVVFRLGF